MTVLHAVLIGVIQGLTEFLPVSSSAHLLLARELFGWQSDQFGLSFDVACHIGTLAAIVVYFRLELASMVASLPQLLDPSPSAPVRLMRLLIIGTIPIVLVGFVLADAIEASMRTPIVAVVALAVGAVVLLVAERRGSQLRDEWSLTAAEAFSLGVAQATALIPGVSRSGIIIAVAVLVGLRRDAAARFAFLLGIPAILAAGGREGLTLVGRGFSVDELVLFVSGMATSGVIGYFTVRYFISYLTGHRLDVFALYRLGLAASVAIWLIVL